MFSNRKLVAFVALVTVLWLTVVPMSSGLHWAVLPVIAFCIAAPILHVRRSRSREQLPQIPSLSLVASRAPPAA